MKLQRIRLETGSNVVYAELWDDAGLVIHAELSHILQQAAKRGYKIEGVADDPLFTRRLA